MRATQSVSVDHPQVVCGQGASAVIAPDGRLMVVGDNVSNRLGLDTDTGPPVSRVTVFRPVLGHIGPVLAMDIGNAVSLVLTRSGEVWRLGGDNRTCVRLELGLEVILVSALAHTGLVVTPGGELYTLTYKRGNKTRIEMEAELTNTMRPTRIEKNSESLCLVHYQTK